MKIDSAYIEFIIACIDKITSYTSGVTYIDFLNNEMMQDAVIRRIGIIGEASAGVSEEMKEKHSEICWDDLKQLRKRTVHTHVKTEVIWNSVVNELPELKKQLQMIS